MNETVIEKKCTAQPSNEEDKMTFGLCYCLKKAVVEVVVFKLHFCSLLFCQQKSMEVIVYCLHGKEGC